MPKFKEEYGKRRHVCSLKASEQTLKIAAIKENIDEILANPNQSQNRKILFRIAEIN